MGVVNVTPDSFSDGGRWLSAPAAVDHGLRLLEEGADLVDVGGESTRPGADRPSIEEELSRVVPVISELAGAGAVVSVDTMRAEVARAAVAAGAGAVNDVSGGLADANMLPVVADLGVPYVCMHWRGHSADMQDHATYDDVVTEVKAELGERVTAALAAGVRPERLAIDPGIGFAKTADHNWAVLHGLESLHEMGHAVAVGGSRKAFLGALLAGGDGTPRPVDGRDAATGAVSALCAAAGAWCVRVHNVAGSLDAVSVAARWARAVDT
jgi:dihydropteroate synthase